MLHEKLQVLVPLSLLALVSLSVQQCLTPHDSPRKISETAVQNLLQSELRFSADLLHTVSSSLQPSENLIFSPTSVFKAMLLAYFISANHTELSLKRALHLAANQDKLDIMGAYTVQSYYEKLRSAQSQTYQLSCANRLYVEKRVGIQPCMRTLLPEEIFPVQFSKYSEYILKKINNWVSYKTRKVIQNFLNDDQVTRDTLLVLVNAAYFKGAWKSQFEVKDTSERTFYLSSGTKVKTPMMMQENEFKLIHDEGLGVEVLDLPYDGDDISMLVLKPYETGPSAVQQLVKKINPESLQNLVKRLNTTFPTHCSVTIPKFTAEKDLPLTSILESMGVGDLFRETADLSTLSRHGGLSFSEATHKAKMQVNEVGTEAAAATALIGTRMGPQEFVADTPFVYILYHKVSNVILFFGIYNSP